MNTRSSKQRSPTKICCTYYPEFLIPSYLLVYSRTRQRGSCTSEPWSTTFKSTRAKSSLIQQKQRHWRRVIWRMSFMVLWCVLLRFGRLFQQGRRDAATLPTKSHLTWFTKLVVNKRVQQKFVAHITQSFSFHRTYLYIQGHDRENTPNKGVSYMIYYARRRKLL